MLKSSPLKEMTNMKKVFGNMEITNNSMEQNSFLFKIENTSFGTAANSLLKVAAETIFDVEKEFIFLNKKYKQNRTSLMYTLLLPVLEYAKLNLPTFIEFNEKKYDISYSIFDRRTYTSADISAWFKIEIKDLPALLKNSSKINDIKNTWIKIFANAISVNYENISSTLNQCLYGNIYFIKKTFEYYSDDILIYKIENKSKFVRNEIFKQTDNAEYELKEQIEETRYTNLLILDAHRDLVKSQFESYFNRNIINGRSIDRNYRYELYKVVSNINSFDDYSMFGNKLFLETEEEFNDENPEFISNCFFAKGKISADRFDSISRELVLGNYSHGLMKFMSGLKRI